MMQFEITGQDASYLASMVDGASRYFFYDPDNGVAVFEEDTPQRILDSVTELLSTPNWQNGGEEAIAKEEERDAASDLSGISGRVAAIEAARQFTSSPFKQQTGERKEWVDVTDLPTITIDENMAGVWVVSALAKYDDSRKRLGVRAIVDGNEITSGFSSFFDNDEQLSSASACCVYPLDVGDVVTFQVIQDIRGGAELYGTIRMAKIF